MTMDAREVLLKVFGSPFSHHRIYAAFITSLLVFYSTQYLFIFERIPFTDVKANFDKFFLNPYETWSRTVCLVLQGLVMVPLCGWTFRWANGELGPIPISLLLSLPSASLDLFLHSHYLVDRDILVYHRTSQIVSLALAVSSIAYLIPFNSNYLTIDPPPIRSRKRFFNRLGRGEEILSQLLAPALGLVVSVFLSYTSYRFFVEGFFRDHEIMILRPQVGQTAKIMGQPYVHVPMLRPEASYKGYASIVPFILLNAPLPIATALFYLITPSSPSMVSNIVTLSIFIDTLTTLGSKLPVDWMGIFVVAVEAAIRTQIVARVTTWVLVDTKKAVRGESDKKSE